MDRRVSAERIARGPHACPSCDAAVWADPPAPWTLRDYVVRCECCERPIRVHVDRHALLEQLERDERARSGAAFRGRASATDFVDRTGPAAFAWRLVAAAGFVLLAFVVALLGGAPLVASGIVAVVAIIPASFVAPVFVARIGASARAVGRRGGNDVAMIDVQPARWDQWLREGRIRRNERDPAELLHELANHLDPVELDRIRAQLADGAVPVSHLDDLVRFRRSFAARSEDIRQRRRSRPRSARGSSAGAA